MNEQNINNIVNYIQQNPDLTTEILVQNLIQAGYDTSDIRIGLGRLGLSPLAIPGSAPAIQVTPYTTPFMPGRTLIGIAGAVVILIGVYYMGNTNIANMLERVPLLGKKPQLSRPVINDKNPPSLQTTPSPVPQKTPLQDFQKTFNNNTYKITEKVFFNGITDEQFDFTYYTENGFVDRIDNPLGLITIMRTQAYFVLRQKTKTFFKVESTDLQYKARADELQKLLLINRLLQPEANATWEQIGEAEWKYQDNTTDYYILTFNSDSLPIKIVRFNQQNRIEDELSYSYEPIIINEELLAIPKDYREVTEQELNPQQP